MKKFTFLTACAIQLGFAMLAWSQSPATSPSSVATVEVVETTPDQQKLLQPQPNIIFKKRAGSSVPIITVNESSKFQQMDGFGASLTDSSAWIVWNKLDQAQRQQLWQDLFSPTNGIGINMLRQPMGASDFSANGNYSYDDVPTGQTDSPQAHFSIAHDEGYIIPLLRQALAVNPSLKIVALPWSAPAWMKTTGTMNGGGLKREDFPSLARYFVKFAQAYAHDGLPLYALAVQNEPLYSSETYPTELLPAEDEASFIGDHLGPALMGAGLQSVKIFAYDHNWNKPDYPETILSQAAASHFVAGSSFHCYAGDVSAQSAVKKAFPEKDIWFTECSGITPTSFAKDLRRGVETLLIGATRNWARSVIFWNLALDQRSGPTNGGCMNCRGVVTIDDSKPSPVILRNVEYYILGHLARFVSPGAYRIDSNTFGPDGIEDVAFQNPDGSIVLLVTNGGTSDAECAVRWHNQEFRYKLSPGAVATFRWQ